MHSTSHRKQKRCSRFYLRRGNWISAAWASFSVAKRFWKTERFSRRSPCCPVGRPGCFIRRSGRRKPLTLTRKHGKHSRSSTRRSSMRNSEPSGRSFFQDILMGASPWACCPAGQLPCYTWAGTYRECADVKIARQAARLCGQPHRTIPVGAEFLSQFPHLAQRAVYISDGTMDVTGSIDLYLQQSARRIAPVRLSGVCGGEILRRLVMFKPDPPE